MTNLLNRVSGRTGIIAIFSVSFVFFLLITFPYEILKESISNGLSRVTGLAISMDDFGAKLPAGMQATGLSVTGRGAKAKTLKFNRLSVRMNPLYLLAGKLAANVYIENPDLSSMSIFLAFPLSGIVSGKDPIPSQIELDSQKFRVDELTAFIFSALATGADVNPLVGPVLQGVGFSGKLDGSMDLAVDSSSPQDSSGSIKLKFIDATLKLSDPSLGLPDQKFTKAGFQGSLTNGLLNLEKGSGFESDELTLSAGGSIAVKSPFPTSQLQLELLVKLQKSLGEKFGFLLDAFSGGAAKNGELRLQVKGPISQPATHPI